MPKERGWQRSRRDPPRKANDWKRNGQRNQPELKAHSQQNKARTPWTAESYQMYLGHGPEEKKSEDSWNADLEPPPHHIRIPDHENHTTANET